MNKRIQYLMILFLFLGISACTSTVEESNNSNHSEIDEVVLDSLEGVINDLEDEIDDVLEGIEDL